MSRDVLAEQRDIDRAVEGQTICTLFRDTVAKHPDSTAARWKEGGAWKERTWREVSADVRDLANGLVSLGLKAGEFANILSSNRPEYYVADLAVLHAGGVPVSLYNTLAPEQIEYIVNHCEAGFVILENAAFYERIAGIRSRIPRVQKVILLEGAKEVGGDWVISWEDVLAAGRRFGERHRGEIDARAEAIRPEGLATLIYTSGTTGPPKGVMVTQQNVTWTLQSVLSIWAWPQGMRHISYLPMAHIAERMVGYYAHIRNATTCSFCPNPQQIAQYLVEVKPELFFAVPRIWVKLHSALTTAIANNPDENQRAFANAAIDTCLEKVRFEQAGKPVAADLAERAANAAMVTKLIRSRIGLDEVKIASTGAAPLAPEVLEWFHAIGIPIAEVYGQSEDTGPTSWNRPGRVKIGTVGPSIPGVEVRLAEDGELLVRGGNVTGGYYKDPELTVETFRDGWLHSGDVAVLDAEGFIRIVDRKKEIIITAGGKNIAPSNLENMLKQKPLVGQACVIGDKRPFVSALVVLDPETAAQWASSKRLPADRAALATHPQVVAEVQSYVDDLNRHVANVEHIRKFTILPGEWTVDSGELTPTLKMKRKIVNQKYADAIEAMYR
ncbi:MAG: AMP-dependent synthetase/ligase [Candidatus Binatia bacterium]